MAGPLTYKAWVHTQPCACQPCISRVEQHHSTNGETTRHAKSIGGRRGKSQRVDDAQSFPLCPKHHDHLHISRGFAEGWDKAQKRRWQDEQVAIYQALYEEYLSQFTEEELATMATSFRASVTPTVEQEAAAFASHHSLDRQIQHNLERLLRKAVKGEMI